MRLEIDWWWEIGYTPMLFVWIHWCPLKPTETYWPPRLFMIISCYNWIRCIEIHWTPRFQFKHNVCGRRTYGEGVADAVQFIARKAAEKSEKKAESQLGEVAMGWVDLWPSPNVPPWLGPKRRTPILNQGFAWGVVDIRVLKITSKTF